MIYLEGTVSGRHLESELFNNLGYEIKRSFKGRRVHFDLYSVGRNIPEKQRFTSK